MLDIFFFLRTKVLPMKRNQLWVFLCETLLEKPWRQIWNLKAWGENLFKSIAALTNFFFPQSINKYFAYRVFKN